MRGDPVFLTGHAVATAPTFRPSTDCLQFPDRRTLEGRRSAWDLFFDARPAAALAADAVGRPIREMILKFVTSPPNGLVMQAGDFGHLLDPAMSQSHGFTTGDPSPLLFVESI
jgi:hypothetical protein